LSPSKMWKMRFKDIIQEIKSLAAEQKNDREYRYNCPVCGDTRKRLYIKKEKTKIYAHCFNGGCKLNIKGLVIPIYQSYKEILKSPIPKSYKFGNIQIVNNLPQEYLNFLLKYLDYNFVSYLLHKGIVGYSMVYDRIMFKCNGGYIGRSINQLPKWVKFGAKFFVAGTNYLKSNSKIVIVEDCISALKVAQNALCCTIALLGIQMPLEIKSFVRSQNMANERHIFIWLDKDSAGIKGALKLKKELDIFSQVHILNHREPKLCLAREIKEVIYE